MKSSLSHLPSDKQAIINHMLNIIVEKIDPEKVILYGSYATGKWVEDEYYEDGHQMEYRSDFDFLVITKAGDIRPDYEVQEIVEHRSGLKETVSAITHDIEYINSKLSDGQYFFSDIQKEGIMLYDAGNVPLAQKRNLTNAEKKQFAQNDFDNWFSSAQSFLDIAKYCLQKKDLKIGVFELHQAAERTYNTIILVFRGYKPKTHNLEKLHRYAKHFSKEISHIFPRNNVEERHLFDLLRKGYVEARYDRKYHITNFELESLIQRIEKMQIITEFICKEKIASLDLS